MATAPATFARPFRSIPKTGIFAFVAVMTAYVLVHNESFLVNASDPIWTHYQPFKWWLLPHGLAGATALLLGPFQFSDRLRQKFAKYHRVAGRFYVGGVFIAAPLGIYIQKLQGIPTFTLATVVDAFLWVSTTAIALGFAMKRMIPQHKQWMTRSYAVAIVFLEVRVISGLMGYDEDVRMLETIVWLCLACSLFVGDIVIQAQEYAAKRKIIKVAATASA
jgi:uncharacterized membrane protein